MTNAVSAVIVTRGDRSLDRITASLPFDDIVIVDNSQRPVDLSVFGRYAGIAEARHDRILVQDDDVLLPPATIERLVANYDQHALVANMPQEFRARYRDHTLVGFGAIFHRDLPRLAFAKFLARHPALGIDPGFLRACDVVFTALVQRRLLDLPVDIQPYAYGDDRMFKRPGHTAERERFLHLALGTAKKRVRARAAS